MPSGSSSSTTLVQPGAFMLRMWRFPSLRASPRAVRAVAVRTGLRVVWVVVIGGSSGRLLVSTLYTVQPRLRKGVHGTVWSMNTTSPDTAKASTLGAEYHALAQRLTTVRKELIAEVIALGRAGVGPTELAKITGWPNSQMHSIKPRAER